MNIIHEDQQKSFSEDAKRRLVFLICDGWGIAPQSDSNPLRTEDAPNIKKMIATYPTCTLTTSFFGKDFVGESYHRLKEAYYSLGTGQKPFNVFDSFRSIFNKGDNDYTENFNLFLKNIKEDSSVVHFFIPLPYLDSSDSFEFLKYIQRVSKKKFFIHCILDSFDLRKQNGIKQVEVIRNSLEKINNVFLVSVSGKDYIFNTQFDLEKAQYVYGVLKGKSDASVDYEKKILDFYEKKFYDNEIPTTLIHNSEVYPGIRKYDTLLFFNFGYPPLTLLLRQYIDDLLPLNIFTITPIFESYDSVKPLFSHKSDLQSFSQSNAKKGCSQFVCAPPSTFPYISYTFRGNREEIYHNEVLKLITQESKKSCSSSEDSQAVVSNILKEYESGNSRIIIASIPLLYEIAQVGTFEEVVEAWRSLDQMIKKITQVVLSHGDIVCITSSLGMAEDRGAFATDLGFRIPSQNNVLLILVHPQYEGLSFPGTFFPIDSDLSLYEPQGSLCLVKKIMDLFIVESTEKNIIL